MQILYLHFKNVFLVLMTKAYFLQEVLNIRLCLEGEQLLDTTRCVLYTNSDQEHMSQLTYVKKWCWEDESMGDHWKWKLRNWSYVEVITSYYGLLYSDSGMFMHTLNNSYLYSFSILLFEIIQFFLKIYFFVLLY